MFKLGDKVKVVSGYGTGSVGQVCGIESTGFTTFYFVEIAVGMIIRVGERQLVCCFQ